MVPVSAPLTSASALLRASSLSKLMATSSTLGFVTEKAETVGAVLSGFVVETETVPLSPALPLFSEASAAVTSVAV